MGQLPDWRRRFSMRGERQGFARPRRQRDEIDDRVLRSTRSYRSSFEIDGWGDTADQLHKLSVQQKWPEMAKLVTEEMVHAFAAAAPMTRSQASLRNALRA